MAHASGKPLHGLGAVVTGAASGIGAATAEAVHRNGADVLLVDVDEPRLTVIAAHLGTRAAACVADLRDPAAVDHVVASAHEVLPAIDVLVNDAGVSWKTPFLDVT